MNAPERLRQFFGSIAESDVAKTGVDHRRELKESLAALVRLILYDEPANYAWAPGMKEAMRQILLHQLRNPETGWWGERYVHNDKTYFVDDLSITFHVVSYLHGDVPDLGRIVATALAPKSLEYPQGVLDGGHYVNHHNMDLAVLFHFGWSAAIPAERRVIADEMRNMLDWCLRDSLQPDGSFRRTPDDDSIEEAEYFGTAFLSRIGYFDRANRFWTQETFPHADGVRARIRGFIRHHLATGAAGGAYYRNALAMIGSPRTLKN